MATFTHLAGWNVNVVKGVEQEQTGDFANTWSLIFQEQTTGNQIRFSMRREARDELVRQLTNGVVLAGGELPRL